MRHPVPQYILDFYNINIYNSRIECEENKWINHIQEAFYKEITHLQYPIDIYRLDMYFPTRNIIIEVDEYGHSSYDVQTDYKRTLLINKTLKNPTWIRFDPYSSESNIFKIIGRIYEVIMTNQ